MDFQSCFLSTCQDFVRLCNASGQQSSSCGLSAAPPPPGSAAPAPGTASARWRFLAAITEEGASEEEGDGPVREVADGAPLETRPDPWEEGTRGAPHQSWCQCRICQPCPCVFAREWGGALPPGTAGTGEEPSSSRAGVPGISSASPVHRLGTAIGDRPHDRAMRELGPNQREWRLTRPRRWWTRKSHEHDWHPWLGERWATWLPNLY